MAGSAATIMNKRKLGAAYENKAAEYLENRERYKILQRNYRCPLGEIDLIAVDAGVLVFVEVKYRKDLALGTPFEAVHYKKQKTIQNIARYYLMEHPDFFFCPCRFDVVGILGEKLTLIKNAFELQ